MKVLSVASVLHLCELEFFIMSEIKIKYWNKLLISTPLDVTLLGTETLTDKCIKHIIIS
jgi:hypothetical protein